MPRWAELLLVVLLAPLWLPLLAVVAALVALRIGTPVLFRQMRPGKDGRPFELVKFRTMTDERAADGTLLPDDVRLTAFGRWLRSTSLDELPELLNVLRGDMSLVGPRPLLIEYLPRYSETHRRRHEVRPGITGWAQVNGRNALSWPAKFDLDVWYVDNRSFWLDLRVLALTIDRVVRRSGIASGDSATMTLFRGYDD
jgi:lipopolysaccharide/colanic/teichoic acid biosynthesis glycosyltransferase